MRNINATNSGLMKMLMVICYQRTGFTLLSIPYIIIQCSLYRNLSTVSNVVPKNQSGLLNTKLTRETTQQSQGKNNNLFRRMIMINI